jgi:hypothetical protein
MSGSTEPSTPASVTQHVLGAIMSAATVTVANAR